MKVFFDEPEFDAQFVRTLGKAVVGMADVGECFAAASRMTAGDYCSWRDGWHAAAERVERIADEAAKVGRRRSAGEAYLRASEYHRASYFFDAWTWPELSCARRGRRPGAASERGSTTSVSMSTW